VCSILRLSPLRVSCPPLSSVNCKLFLQLARSEDDPKIRSPRVPIDGPGSGAGCILFKRMSG
jgi:hypothetical protein